MGWVVDHTGEARFTRPAYWGPLFVWPPRAFERLVLMQMNAFKLSFAFPTRRALICSTAAINALGARMTMDDWLTQAHFTYGPNAHVELGNRPWNRGTA